MNTPAISGSTRAADVENSDGSPSVPPLRKNLDFQILWAAQVVSTLGAHISALALPLFVLAVTDSAAKAGLTAAAGTLPRLLVILHAGALVDRWNRKLLMIGCDGIRAAAMASIAILYLSGDLPFVVLPIVAFIEGTGSVFFEIAERAVIRRVVHDTQLPQALAQYQIRTYGAFLAGPPLGGFLFGLGRAVPFVVDAFSYLASIVGLLFVRAPFEEARDRAPGRVHVEIVEGLRWVWQEPFLRVTSLLVMGSDLVINALFLGIIVIAQKEGASPGTIGVMAGLIGVSGILGALIAPRLARLLSVRAVVAITLWEGALLVLLLAFVREPLAMGLIMGGILGLHPTWDAVIGSYRLRVTPDHLQGRTQSVYRLLSLGAVPPGLLLVGVLLETAGARTTVLACFVVMLTVALAGSISSAVRSATERGSEAGAGAATSAA